MIWRTNAYDQGDFFSFTKYHHINVEGMLVFLEYLNWLYYVR